MEEYDSIQNMNVYTKITEDEYQAIKHTAGRPIPTMCMLTIKYKNGIPDRAKSRIVVLGNQQQHTFSPHQTYASVLSQDAFRTILSLAVSRRRILKQGDVKNAFCNGILPENEIVVCKPPQGCPVSKPGTLWRLNKTLYGLVRSPKHW